VSLNQTRYSSGFPSSVPFPQLGGDHCHISSNAHGLITVVLTFVVHASTAGFGDQVSFAIDILPEPVTRTKSSARMRLIVSASRYLPGFSPYRNGSYLIVKHFGHSTQRRTRGVMARMNQDRSVGQPKLDVSGPRSPGK
jgi:hypothetical protein